MNGIVGAVIGSSIGLSYEIKKTKDIKFYFGCSIIN